jgi:hypothetical protein
MNDLTYTNHTSNAIDYTHQYSSVKENLDALVCCGMTSGCCVVSAELHQPIVLTLLQTFIHHNNVHESFPAWMYNEVGCHITHVKGNTAWYDESFIFNSVAEYHTFLLVWG